MMTDDYRFDGSEDSRTPPADEQLIQCDECGGYSPVSKLRRCRYCGKVFYLNCSATHNCRTYEKPKNTANNHYEQPSQTRYQRPPRHHCGDRIKKKKLIIAAGVVVVLGIIVAIMFGTGFVSFSDKIVGTWVPEDDCDSNILKYDSTILKFESGGTVSILGIEYMDKPRFRYVNSENSIGGTWSKTGKDSYSITFSDVTWPITVSGNTLTITVNGTWKNSELMYKLMYNKDNSFTYNTKEDALRNARYDNLLS